MKRVSGSGRRLPRTSVRNDFDAARCASGTMVAQRGVDEAAAQRRQRGEALDERVLADPGRARQHFGASGSRRSWMP